MIGVLLAVFVAMETPVESGAQSEAPATCRGVTFTVKDHRALAEKVWRRPGGPTQKQKRKLGHQRRCAAPGHLGKMVKAARKARHDLAPVRHRKSLWRGCSQSNVRPCIEVAALIHHQSYGYAISVASCESGLNPYAVGGGIHYGLFQFLGSTFASTPYAGKDVFSARWNSMAAMWMWKVGRIGEWACA